MSLGSKATTQKRRRREKRTISQMIVIYCKGVHINSGRTEEAHCGRLLCPECALLDSYAVDRTEQCRQMGAKTLCENCESFCYDPIKRQAVREVMRYAGPRMIFCHPIAALKHLLNKRRSH
ncbi:MAG: nitrous oxide-stimulated promoter family protein [Coriobacteriia bacterium]|nr:nitrous oxide-stimulated promoter family protein [Coriobacteriia bacterium]